MIALDTLKKLIEAGATAGSFDAQLWIIDDGDRRFETVPVEFKIEEIGPNMRPNVRGGGGIDMREASREDYNGR